jgi:hypothetical protein
MNIDIDQIKEITDYINNYRSIHQASPLIWNDTIKLASQNWSNFLLHNNIFKHSGNPLYGENIAYFEGYNLDTIALLKLAVDNWYNEVKKYDFSNPDFSKDTGHFTCLVWKSSTSFALGLSIDNVTKKVYIVMNTSPPGNYIGQFKDNVLPAINMPIVIPTKITHFPQMNLETKTYIIKSLNTITGELITFGSLSTVLKDIMTLKNYINTSISFSNSSSNSSSNLSYPYYPYDRPYYPSYPYYPYYDPYDHYLYAPKQSDKNSNIEQDNEVTKQ